jgi:hypothetical protein
MPVDRRLRLAACTAPLALGWYGARRDMVEVALPGRARLAAFMCRWPGVGARLPPRRWSSAATG